MKTIKIAVVVALAFGFIATVGFTAYSQNLSVPKVVSTYLNSEDEDIMNSKNSYDIPLRYASMSSLRNRGGASFNYQGVLSPAANAAGIKSENLVHYPIPYEITPDLSYRNVKYIYDEDRITPKGIVEVLPNGEEFVICEITTVRMENMPQGTPDGVVVGGDIITATILTYRDDDGFDVTIRINGEPDWLNLLSAASIADGVYYGFRSGTKVTKVYNNYDGDGNRIYGIQKIFFFDEEGALIRSELTKERSSYKGGQLISRSEYKVVDGKMEWVKTLTNIYIGGVKWMEMKSTLNYDERGVITSSTSENTVFDKNGNEASYNLVTYEGSYKAHSISRQTTRDSEGRQTRYTSKDTWYSDNGYIERIDTIEEEDDYDASGLLIRKRFFSQTEERVMGCWGTEYLRPIYENEKITDYEYDAEGALIKEHESCFNFVDMYSGIEYFTEVTDRLTTWLYDIVNGVKKLINYHNIYVAGTAGNDRVLGNKNYSSEDDITCTYNGEGRLEHVTTIRTDQWFTGGECTSWNRFVSDESYEYDGRGNLILKKTYSFNIDPIDGSSIEKAYQYDENNNLISESTMSFSRGEMLSLTTTTYLRYEDGSIASIVTHQERSWNPSFTDSVWMYNREGSLTYSSSVSSDGRNYLEEREYYADGSTLKRIDIASDEPSYPFYIIYESLRRPTTRIPYGDDGLIPGKPYIDEITRKPYTPYGHYELHETYREDGKITHREESNNYTQWDGAHDWSWNNGYNITEDWAYTDAGVLTHYINTGTYDTKNGLFDHAGLSVRTIERTYDPATGRIIEEKFSSTGGISGHHLLTEENLRTDNKEYPEIEYYKIGQEENIPQDVKEFIGGVVKAFNFSSSLLGQKETKIVYSYDESGKLVAVEIKGTDTADGVTNQALHCIVGVDPVSGNIASIVISNGSQWVETVLNDKDKVIIYDQRTELPDAVKYSQGTTADNPELDSKFAMLETKAQQAALPEGVTMTSELACDKTAREEVRP